MKTDQLVACVFLLVLYIGIGAAKPPPKTSKRVVTFNAALTTLFNTHDQDVKVRAKQLIISLQKLDADVVCLQEVWFEVIKRYIVTKMNKIYRYSFSASHLDTTTMMPREWDPEPPCQTFAFPAFFQCMKGCNQHSNSTDTLVQCSIVTCGLMDLPQGCITCLASHTDAIQCYGYNSTQINGGGLLVLSKKDILNPQLTYFHPFVKVLSPTAYITGQIEGLGTTVCAHLVADLGPTYLERELKGQFSSYAGQNFWEAETLANVTAALQQVTLMGGLNTGPAIPANQISEELPLSYAALTTAGFNFPYVTAVGQCTYCSDNFFVVRNKSSIVDHVGAKGAAISNSKKVLSGKFTARGSTTKLTLSDHYGVEATIG